MITSPLHPAGAASRSGPRWKRPSPEPEGGQSAAAEGGGQYAWLGTTRLARHWLGPGQTAELKLHAAFAGVGAAVLEGLSVAVCGWRDAGGEPTWLDEPALCDGPPPCTVRVKPGL